MSQTQLCQYPHRALQVRGPHNQVSAAAGNCSVFAQRKGTHTKDKQLTVRSRYEGRTIRSPLLLSTTRCAARLYNSRNLPAGRVQGKGRAQIEERHVRSCSGCALPLVLQQELACRGGVRQGGVHGGSKRQLACMHWHCTACLCTQPACTSQGDQPH